MARERLHKVLAAAGIASRRRCEELIAEGHVTVDGVEVRSMGFLVDPEQQDIRFDEEKISLERAAYYAVNKPDGYICTNSDPQGRRTVVSLIRDQRGRRLYTVGRLDEASDGLILVTNDGDFAHRLTHPRFGIDKTYQLKLRGYLEQEALEKVRKGVWLSTGRTQSMFVKLMKRSKQFSYVRVVIHEGKNRQLRRIFAKVGHPVFRLTRIQIGGIGLKGMQRAEVRTLKPAEVDALRTRCERFEREKSSEPQRNPSHRRSSHSERYAGEKAPKDKRAGGKTGQRRRTGKPGGPAKNRGRGRRR